MQQETEEPLLHYSTKIPKGRRGCLFIITGVMVFALLFLFGSATYLFVNAGEVDHDSTFVGDIIIGVVVTFTGFIILPFPLFFIIALMRETSYVEEYLVYEENLIYREIYPKKDRTKAKELPFTNMNWGLIGNHSRFVPGSGTTSGPGSYYQNEVMLLLKFGEEYHIIRIEEEEDLYQWIDLIGGHGLPVYYHPYNLSRVMTQKDEIDFDAIEKTPWEDSEGQKPIFKETKRKVFEDWKPVYKKADT